jgi:asparagine synthase (glutamine-hydrolysing)
MCGIVGIADLGGRSRPEQDSLLRMRDRLAHRGPDDAGCEILADGRVGLAHRRLAVISPTAIGRQPMADARQQLCIVFNGEIYNYRELRKHLLDAGHTFRTDTDTEVILNAFREWDLDCLQRLRGMFALALWDSRRALVVLARDRLGIKPLYYAERSGVLFFASEPKAILAHPSMSPAVEPSALLDYLSYGYCPWDRCAFAGLKKLPPGHVLVHDARGTQILSYWQPEPKLRMSGEEAAEAVRLALLDAVRCHLVSDVPLGAFLSGGVDSSAVVAGAAVELREPLRTISIDFDVGESELPYARDVAARHRTRHLERTTSARDCLPLLDSLALAYDEPLADTSTVPTYLMCQTARQDLTVALSGDGGDELFAGYGWYEQGLRAPLPGGRAWNVAINHLRGLPLMARLQLLLRRTEPQPGNRHLYTMGLFDRWELERLAGPGLARTLPSYDSAWLLDLHFRRDLPLLTSLQLFDLRTFLVDDILVKVDRASMASSLEVRPPLLDHKLVEVAFDIDPHAMVADGRGKWPLRRAISDMVPASVLERTKRGFSAPISLWFRSGLAATARRRLRHGSLASDGIIQPAFVDWMIDNLTERRWAKLWSLLVLEQWYDRWMRA